MSQLPLPGKESYIDECSHGGKAEEEHNSSPATRHPSVVFGPKEEARLWRRIDLRLMPMIALMYLFSFMDRGEFFIEHAGCRAFICDLHQAILVRIG